MKNILVAQSGGPTSAINATLAGVIEQSLKESGYIGKIYGAKHGILGVLQDDLLDLSEIFKEQKEIDRLYYTPSSALGTCRFKLKNYIEDSSQYETALEIFNKYDIGYFAYIGGNDSMDTVAKFSAYLKSKNPSDITVVGLPKTIDNDLALIDHCPGFGSAAKYIGTTFAEIERDAKVYGTKSVTIIEVMGRNAGWLTAASALSRIHGADGPDLIYLCEPVFDTEKFIEDIKERFDKNKSVLVAVSEGVKGKSGKYISEDDDIAGSFVDAFGHKNVAGSCRVLERLVLNEIGCKVRPIQLSLIQRSAAPLASATDLAESKHLGILGVKSLVEGKGAVMMSHERISSDPYELKYGAVPVDQVANKEKKVPLEWIAKNGSDVTDDIIKYMLPLIQGEVPGLYKNGIPDYKILF